MSEVSELERELDKQRRKVEEKRDKRNHFRKLAGDKSAQIHDLRDRASEARDDRDENRKLLVVIRDRLEKIEADGVEADEQERFDRLSVRQEALVDDNEEQTAILHRVLPNIAEQTKRREEVRDLRERFGDDLDHAIQRKDQIKKALKEAKEDAASNPLGTDLFVVAEFDCNDGRAVPGGIVPHLKTLCAEHLVPLRKSGGSVSINSGYRHAAYNASIGGATQSYHIYDLRMSAPAADHIQAGRSATAVQQWHDGHNPPDAMGYYPGFTHIDSRGYRVRWSGAA